MTQSPIIVALDIADRAAIDKLVAQLSPDQCALKVGKEAYVRFGPELVKALVAKGFRIFLDLKFHDIPNTVARACVAAADLGVWMVNVHASGGEAMLRQAQAALAGCDHKPLLIGVTVLTSMDDAALQQVGVADTVDAQAIKLAKLAKNCGLDGVVCSAKESKQLRTECGKDFLLVTPGIRPEQDSVDDQVRVLTPQAAMAAGSDYLVMGRPITQAANPAEKLKTVLEDIA